MSMFCYQCEQAAQGKGCDTQGVCGKQPDVAALQDLLVFQSKGIGFLMHELNNAGEGKNEYSKLILELLFTTVTNVNFDVQKIFTMVQKADSARSTLVDQYNKIISKKGIQSKQLPAAAITPAKKTLAECITQGQSVSIPSQHSNPDILSLQQLLVYGLKGLAAYADHALLLGSSDNAIFIYISKALAELTNTNSSVETLVGLNLECGEKNIRAMELLNQAHIKLYGTPQPTPVLTGTKKGPAIIVSGHDLYDLEQLLKQTQGSGIHIYTHGEMLPAHGYPGLKKYPHLAGHFGTAWQNQQKEFDGVPAAFLFTTNCIQKPKPSYIENVFTTGLVAWPGVKHVCNSDFSAVITKAKQLGGFSDSNGKSLLTGFGHDAVLSVADKVINAVKTGTIKHFFLVGGCDGAKPGRNYYTELVEKSPKDTIILTLACGKFRFNHLELGDIGGIPRLLDIGQCNDAYSAVKIAQALAGAFNCGINDLPLSLILSWYEQKAVVILLSLLFLGVKNIRLGPTLPAFITPNILKFLVEKYAIKPTTTAENDLAEILKK